MLFDYLLSPLARDQKRSERRPPLQPLLDGDVESVEDGTRFD
jgi:hypothetical protein